MNRAGPAPVLAVLLLGACGGEIEQIEFVDRPRRDDFEAYIQPMFENLGCSAGTFCHSAAQGNFAFVVDPDAAALQDNFLGARAFLDPDQPDQSRLLRALVPREVLPDANHTVLCFKSTDACGYRQLLAWASWTASGDPRPGDFGCAVEVPVPTACDDPQALDVCCPRSGR